MAGCKTGYAHLEWRWAMSLGSLLFVGAVSSQTLYEAYDQIVFFTVLQRGCSKNFPDMREALHDALVNLEDANRQKFNDAKQNPLYEAYLKAIEEKENGQASGVRVECGKLLSILQEGTHQLPIEKNDKCSATFANPLI